MDERSPGLSGDLTPMDRRTAVLRLYPGVLVNRITNYLMQSLPEGVRAVTHESEAARLCRNGADLSGIGRFTPPSQPHGLAML
ncbi:hypothetical protein SAFG77S_05146 [Streptomyces afghaniensis]